MNRGSRLGASRRTEVVLAILVSLAFIFAVETLSGRTRLAFGSYRIEHSENDWHLEATFRGDIELAEDESSVLTMARHSSLLVREIRGGERRRLELVRGGDGEMETEYWAGGRRQEFGPEERAWLARTLPEIMRLGAYRVEERVGRLLRQGGLEGALAEIPKIRSETSLRRHLVEIVRQGGEEAVPRAVQLAAKSFDSDHQRRRFLCRLSRGDLEREEVRVALAPALAAMDSSHELRRLLEELWEIGPAPELRPILLAAAPGVESDHELSRFLIRVAEETREELSPAFFAAAETLDSEFERRRALEEVLLQGHTRETEAAAVLRLGSSLGSDHEKARLLTTWIEGCSDLESLRPALRAQIATLTSEHERQRVEAVLAEYGGESGP